MAIGEVNSLVETAHQSPPVDPTTPFDTASLAGKTILITGGASGFGAAFARKWAQCGAHIALGDVNDAAGEALIAELRATTPGGDYHHFHHCDVTDWNSQVAFFRAAVEHSATGGIDAVVPNAGIVDKKPPVIPGSYEFPIAPEGSGPDADPVKPNLMVMQVNLIGVMYTVNLAIYWLQRNASSPKYLKAVVEGTAPATRDRHLLLISSVAGIMPLPGQAQYTTSKHGVAGLFRSLRGSLFRQNIRTNMLCPYFVDTNILSAGGMLMLAGSGMAEVEDVVAAGTRFMACEDIRGRSFVIGPRMYLEGDENDTHLVGIPASAKRDAAGKVGKGEPRAIWECYGHDFENVDAFIVRYVRLLNGVTLLRGWVGFFKDFARTLFFRKSGLPQAK